MKIYLDKLIRKRYASGYNKSIKQTYCKSQSNFRKITCASEKLEGQKNEKAIIDLKAKVDLKMLKATTTAQKN